MKPDARKTPAVHDKARRIPGRVATGLILGVIFFALATIAIQRPASNPTGVAVSPARIRLAVAAFDAPDVPADSVNHLRAVIVSALRSAEELEVVASDVQLTPERWRVSVRQIGRASRARFILDATVRAADAPGSAGGALLLTPRLIQSSDALVIWSERYAIDAAGPEALVVRLAADVHVALGLGSVMP